MSAEGVPIFLPPEAINAIAAEAAEIVLARLGVELGKGGPEWLSVSAAAEYLSASPTHVRRLMANGSLAYSQEDVGCRIAIARRDLDALPRRASEGLVSDYNDFHDRLLEADLGVEELRLGIALACSLLGFRKRAEHLGQRLLRERARLDGRSFTRARDGLVEKNLIRYTPPTALGRGSKGYYELILDDEESTAPERDFEAESTAGSTTGSTAPKRSR